MAIPGAQVPQPRTPWENIPFNSILEPFMNPIFWCHRDIGVGHGVIHTFHAKRGRGFLEDLPGKRSTRAGISFVRASKLFGAIEQGCQEALLRSKFQMRVCPRNNSTSEPWVVGSSCQGIHRSWLCVHINVTEKFEVILYKRKTSCTVDNRELWPPIYTLGRYTERWSTYLWMAHGGGNLQS